MPMTLGYNERRGGWTLEFTPTQQSSQSGATGAILTLGFTYAVAGILVAQPHPTGKAVGVGILAIPDPLIFAAGYSLFG